MLVSSQVECVGNPVLSSVKVNKLGLHVSERDPVRNIALQLGVSCALTDLERIFKGPQALG
jgi:hypothetical protein